MGASPFELFQTPEKPYLVDYFNLMLQGEMDKAMEIFWMLTPVRMTHTQQSMQYVMLGTYHWPMWKYYQWLVGGNGGYTRQPVMKLYQHDMEAAKNALRAIGITPRESDDEFYVGRVNFGK
jgi:4-hydroxy-tetrahydrodipicolinate synthase